MPKPEDLDAALARLEAALDAFAPPLTLTAQQLGEIDLGPSKPLEPAKSFAGAEEALDPPIEVLRAALGEL